MSNPISEEENSLSRDKKGNRRGRHTVNLHTEIYSKLGEYISKWGNSKENVVNDAVYQAVFKRDQFLKMYAPHIILEHSTPNALYILDNQLQKTAVVKAKWNNIIEGEDNGSLLSLKCELCD